MSHIALWIDHNEARIFHVEATTFDEATISSPNHHVRRHPKHDEQRTHNHPDDEHRFFHEIAGALVGAERILIMGPSKTKLLLLRYLQRHAPLVEARVVGLETVDHPTDRQLAAYVRHYFDDDAPRHGVKT
jgi:stalled ribosome rescue protein Dom34